MRLSFILIFTLVGCAGTPQQIDALIIQNKTDRPARDVTLRVPAKGTVVACSIILPRSECSVGFQPQNQDSNPANLSWTQVGQHYTVPLIGNKEPAIHPDYPYKAIVTILNNGLLDVELD